MKRLWKIVPPVMSDVLGFQAVLNTTGGFGIIDDPSRYKPVTAGRGAGSGGEFRRHGDGIGRGRRGDRNGGMRVTDSGIRSEDIITGTERKVLDAFREIERRNSPDFVLLCHGPSASMIGSDLEADAQRITAETGIPALNVDIDGSRDYLYGVSAALEAMGRLLLAPRETVRQSINILGANTIDWSEEELASCETWVRENGFQVLSRWGMKESTEALVGAAGAQVNLVVSAAGLRLARYMEAEYSVPYVCGAPFGAENCRRLLRALRGETHGGAAPAPEGRASVLVVGEQYAADAIRFALESRGLGPVKTASFYEMDMSLARSGDKKLSWEDALRELLADTALETVFCDPDCRPLADRALRWIDMPNGASHSVYERRDPMDMVNTKLDRWLDEVLS